MDDDNLVLVWKWFMVGCLSGGIGVVSSNSFDLIKTRM